MMNILKLGLVAACITWVGSAMAADEGSRYTGEHFATRSPVLARNGMAATSHPIASSIAVDIVCKILWFKRPDLFRQRVDLVDSRT